MKPLYIFDLDGTLADTSHRQHILGSDAPDKWDQFFAACSEDWPIDTNIATAEMLYKAGADIMIFSGRSDAVKQQTRDWLKTHLSFGAKVPLFMRSVGDYTPDELLKRMWYYLMSDEDRQRLVAVFDDRDKVVDMWRRIPVTCYQVARGAF